MKKQKQKKFAKFETSQLSASNSSGVKGGTRTSCIRFAEFGSDDSDKRF